MATYGDLLPGRLGRIKDALASWGLIPVPPGPIHLLDLDLCLIGAYGMEGRYFPS